MMPTNSSDVEKAPKKRGTKKKAAPKPPLPSLANVGETTTSQGDDGEERQEKPEGQLQKLHNEMLMLKAKTMFEMVEEVEVGNSTAPLRLLYLSNTQADSIASSPNALQKMLEALEIRPPKLVINLLSSWGLRASLMLYPERFYNQNVETAGLLFNVPSFLSAEEEQKTTAQLDMFMSDVILPLAATTNALIIANAITGDCALAHSLSRAFSVQRAKWAGNPPFTILSISPCTPILYYNTGNTYWRVIQRKSKAWQRSNQAIEAKVNSKKYENLDPGIDEVTHDLEPNCTHLIVVDQLPADDKSGDGDFDKGPFLHLRTELIRYLSVDVPSLAMKTGWSSKMENQDMSLQTALNQANAGADLLLIDLRERKAPAPPPKNRLQAAVGRILTKEDIQVDGDPESPSKAKSGERQSKSHSPWKTKADFYDSYQDQEEEARKAFVKASWKEFERTCKLFVGEQSKCKCESFDVCAVAWLHGALFGKMGNSEENVALGSSVNIETQAIPLHRAILNARRERARHRVDRGEGYSANMSEKEIMHYVWDLSSRLTEDARQCLVQNRRLKKEAEKRDSDEWSLGAARFASCVRSLLIHPRVHSINVHDLNASNRKVSQIVQSDRLPKKNSLEGLLLLQQAWGERDICNFLADRYKLYTKTLYVAQLICSWLVVLFTQLSFSSSFLGPSDSVFLMSILSGAVVSLEGYRTRVGPFQLGTRTEPQHAETMLCQLLNEWGDDLMSSTDLQRSMWSKRYPRAHRHFQYSGTLQQEEEDDEQDDEDVLGRVANKISKPEKKKKNKAIDDHYTPLQPDKYVEFRLEKSMNFYQRRIPIYAAHATIFKLILLLCAVVSSALARFEQITAIVLVTAFAAIAATWGEFIDAGSKVERYTKAVRSITKLLNWWKNLSGVEKASTENISRLILDSEQIIANEQTSWMSSGVSLLSNQEGREAEKQQRTPAKQEVTPGEPEM